MARLAAAHWCTSRQVADANLCYTGSFDSLSGHGRKPPWRSAVVAWTVTPMSSMTRTATVKSSGGADDSVRGHLLAVAGAP